MPSNQTNLLQVRLTEAEKRRIKALAASHGLTLGQATVQAFEAWASQLPSRAPAPNPARDTLAVADLEKSVHPHRAAKPRPNQRPAGTKLSSSPGRGGVPNLGAPSRVWLREAAQLDWSKCPAAQSVLGKNGNVWVVRGTRAPLVEILHSVADGHPFLEIAEVFEITLQQLIAVLQFAAENTPSSSLGR